MPKDSLATMRSRVKGTPWEDLEIPLTWALCLERNVSKTQLCREAGISIGATGAWDRGIRQPSKRIWEKISPGRSYEAMRMREAARLAGKQETVPAVPETPISSEPEPEPEQVVLSPNLGPNTLSVTVYDGQEAEAVPSRYEPAEWEKMGSAPVTIIPVPEPESDAVQASNPSPALPDDVDAWDTF